MMTRVAFLSVALAMASCASAESRDEVPSALGAPDVPYQALRARSLAPTA